MWNLWQNHLSGKATSAYPVVSAKPDILGVVEPSTTTAGGDLKQPDKQEATNQDLLQRSLIWRAEVSPRLAMVHLLGKEDSQAHFTERVVELNPA